MYTDLLRGPRGPGPCAWCMHVLVGVCMCVYEWPHTQPTPCTLTDLLRGPRGPNNCVQLYTHLEINKLHNVLHNYTRQCTRVMDIPAVWAPRPRAATQPPRAGPGRPPSGACPPETHPSEHVCGEQGRILLPYSISVCARMCAGCTVAILMLLVSVPARGGPRPVRHLSCADLCAEAGVYTKHHEPQAPCLL